MQVETTHPTKDYSAPLRLWHWVNWFLIAGLLATILFLKVIVQARTAVPEFQRIASQSGLTLSQQQGREMAHVISERIWDWHIGLGLALAAFWLLRMGLEVRGPGAQRFAARLLETARRYRLAPPATKGDASKSLFVNISYAAFYLMLTVMVATGLMLTWADDVAFLGSIEHPVKEVHEVTMYLILAFTATHLVGVLWAELTKDHGLISRMVGGK